MASTFSWLKIACVSQGGGSFKDAFSSMLFQSVLESVPTVQTRPKKRIARTMSKPYDLQTLYSNVYEAETRMTYGRMTRDLREAKEWLTMYPDFWTDENAVASFQEAARNFIRKSGDFARMKKHPMWLLLLQYNEWLATKPKPVQSVQSWDTCPTCYRDVEPGGTCSNPKCTKIKEDANGIPQNRNTL